MNDTTLSAIDDLIVSFEKDTYAEKHVVSLLTYLTSLEEKEDKETIDAIVKVLSFCTKDFVRAPIIDTIKHVESSPAIKASLIAICWESGLDYSNYLDVFVDALLKDKAKLQSVLTYHVVPGKVMAADILKNTSSKVKTVQGSDLNVSVSVNKKAYKEPNTSVKVNNASVIKTDIVADNGVIHVIDTVVMPK